MNFNVIVASPDWSLSGVNVFSGNLVRGLQERGISTEILLTNQKRFNSKPMAIPTDIPVYELPVGELDSYPIRWRAMIRYLEARSPCIYIPNYDFNHSCVSPKLSNRVAIVGIVHSDDPLHYEHTCRLGKYWNSIVAVSKVIAEETASREPTFAQRLVTIPYGVSIAERFPQRSLDPNAPLKIVYHGLLKQHQKRILDLPKIIQELRDRGIPVELTIAGGGPTQQQVMDESQHLVKQGVIRFIGIIPNEKVPELLEQNDVFIMTSEFEGMPNALLEAMGRGCVPVVTNIKSGIPELVQDGFSGYRVPVGNIEMFAERLAILQRDVNLRRQMSLNAYSVADKGAYRTKDMVERYIELFHHILEEAECGNYRRPRGRIIPPASMKLSWKVYLRLPVLKTAMYGKRILSRMLNA